MSDFILSEQAERELKAAIAYSYQRFGRYQAEAYFAGFNKSFSLLAEFPRMGRAVDELRPGLRQFRFQSHYILYSIEIDTVLVRAIVHVRRNMRPDLIE
jgi:toxin ParE1/3/4